MNKFNVMKLANYERDGYEDYDKGVLTIKLPSWNDFHAVVQKLQDYKDYIWRGQRCDNWLLVSKFDRVFPKLNQRNRQKLLTTHLERFRFSIRGRRGENPSKLDGKECWAIGQHYGLNTPLLDWTESPFVGAYFAFVEQVKKVISDDLIEQIEKELSSISMQRFKEELIANGQTEYRAVYALSRDLVRWGWVKKKGEPLLAQFVEFVEPLLDENPRLINQNGLFTISLDGADVKERVQKCYSRRPEEDRIILIEIKIPNNDREECLKSLNQMNINHLTLFPDLYGSTKFCNLKLEIDKY